MKHPLRHWKKWVTRHDVAADDQDAIAHTVLSTYELFADHHDDEIKRLKRAIELDPNSSFALGNLGVALSCGRTRQFDCSP
jgi:adenylate cyclase